MDIVERLMRKAREEGKEKDSAPKVAKGQVNGKNIELYLKHQERPDGGEIGWEVTCSWLGSKLVPSLSEHEYFAGYGAANTYFMDLVRKYGLKTQ